jgi:site-specific DNA-methyltransferase (adenine-specific)
MPRDGGVVCKDGLDGNRNNVWSTPQDLWDTLNAEFAFTLDVCALPWNAKCARYYTPDDDGLAQPWSTSNWCNPPFDRSMAKWYQRAWDEAQRGNLTVCITKGDAHDTAYWHNYIMRASEIRYIRGRAKYRAPDRELAFRSVLIVFRPHCQGPAQIVSVNRQGRVLPSNASDQRQPT